VLPRALVPAVAAALPWMEMVLAAFLILGLFVRFAGWASAGLMMVFLAALAQAKARGLAIDCGCFGGGGAGAGVTTWDIVRDVPLLGVAAFLAWRPEGPLQLDRHLLEEASGDDR
jgi:uncharacterized membrane protein YphA (DoxX/SURF4 family)